MRRLRISRGGLELATAPLHRPLATIGRSPTCEIVLRAPGVQPIHFLLEWIGTGEFSSDAGAWSVFDISASADATGEGVVIGESPENFGGFEFRWVEDQLASLPEIGGGIRESLEEAGTQEPSRRPDAGLLELVQVRSDSGAIEQVVHEAPARRKLGREVRPLMAAPEFKIRWEGGAEGSLASILLEEMPGASIIERGSGGVEPQVSAQLPRASVPVGHQGLVEVIWRDHHFFARLVRRIQVQPAPRVGFKDRLLWKLSALWCLLLAFFLAIGFLQHSLKAPEPPAAPPRIAKVEIYRPAPPAVAEQQIRPKSAGTEVPSAVKPTQAAARPVKAPAAVPVGEIGILGALKKTSGAHPAAAVRPDLVISDRSVSESMSGSAGKILLKNPPQAGALERDESPAGEPSGASASSALQGALSGIASGMAPKSAGPVGRRGGSTYSDGSLLSSAGEAEGSSASGSGESGAFQVAGGLDRETVRRVITSYRNQIRACYERGLIASPKLSGRIVFEWTISPQGPVSVLQIRSTDTGFASLDACVSEVVRSMNFPAAANGRATQVIYPFVFQVKG